MDDEPFLLRALKLGMSSMDDIWDMEFAASGDEALRLISQKKFDAVVTDMRMPNMNGAQLLNQVMRKHPETIRIILSGYSDLSQVVDCVGLTHQFLEKPISLENLQNCLKRITSAKSRLPNEKLSGLIAGLKNLPSLPGLYLEIADALQDPNSSNDSIATIAAKDPALTSKLLQLSNSAFFGVSRKIFSVAEAVQILGVRVIQSLAMAAPLFTSFDRKKCPNFPIDQIWDHSIQTAALGRRISQVCLDDLHLAEQAFCAGILHDVGKIIIADNLSAEYSDILTESVSTHAPLIEIERKHFQATHAEVGAYLLALWGLPVPLIESVACHHQPRRCNADVFCLAGVVHIANGLQHSQNATPAISDSPLDQDYLKQIKLDQQFELWRQALSRGEAI